MNTIPLPDLLREFDQDQDGWLDSDEISEIEHLPSKKFEKFSEVLALSLAQEILKAARSVPERLIPTEDVSFETYLILASLQRLLKLGEGKVIQDHIAADTGLAPARVSMRLNAMDQALNPERGWISRIENPVARHQKLISITETGKKMFKVAQGDYRKQLVKIMGIVKLQELVQLKTILYHLNLTLDPKHSDAESEVDES